MDLKQLAADAAWLAARIQTALDQLETCQTGTAADAEVLRGPLCLLQDAQALLLAYAQGDPYRAG